MCRIRHAGDLCMSRERGVMPEPPELQPDQDKFFILSHVVVCAVLMPVFRGDDGEESSHWSAPQVPSRFCHSCPSSQDHHNKSQNSHNVCGERTRETETERGYIRIC